MSDAHLINNDSLAIAYPEELHLFYNAYSDCSQRVLLMLAEKGLDAALHPLNLLKAEQLSDWYRAITPKCEVPAIIHHGRAMHESCEILRHLDATYPAPSFTPSDPGARTSMDQWLDRAAAFHQTGVIEYLYSMGLGRRPRPQDAAFYRDHVPHRHAFHQARLHGETGCDPVAAEAHLNAQYAALDRALADHPWLAGNDYSLADIAWFPSIFALGIFGFDPSSYPHLHSWQARIRARPAFASGIKRHLLPIPNTLIRFVLRFNNRFGQRR